MDHHTLHSRYFIEGTSGYAIIRRFYLKYNDVLPLIHCADMNDLVNDVFLSLSQTDFTQVRDEQRYVLRAIKLRCWSLLDRAIREKTLAGISQSRTSEGDGVAERAAQPAGHLTEIDGMELMSTVNLFKTRVSIREAELLNMLIDEIPRSEIAARLALNMNTLDTHIRRLRKKLVGHLKGFGYTYKALERFE
jgi:DNA-directed RNA polymerase specialized sigma24 family protein